MYVSHAELNERPGARELAEVATPEQDRLVPYELMSLALTGGDRAAWSAEDNARADAALQRIDDARRDAGAVIDGYLARRGYLPLDPIPPIVAAWCRSITRYFLHQHRLSAEDKDPIVRDYRDALKFLQLTADGKFFLGAEDVNLSSGDAIDVRFDAGENVFSRDQLKSFR